MEFERDEEMFKQISTLQNENSLFNIIKYVTVKLGYSVISLVSLYMLSSPAVCTTHTMINLVSNDTKDYIKTGIIITFMFLIMGIIHVTLILVSKKQIKESYPKEEKLCITEKEINHVKDGNVVKITKENIRKITKSKKRGCYFIYLTTKVEDFNKKIVDRLEINDYFSSDLEDVVQKQLKTKVINVF